MIRQKGVLFTNHNKKKSIPKRCSGVDGPERVYLKRPFIQDQKAFTTATMTLKLPSTRKRLSSIQRWRRSPRNIATLSPDRYANLASTNRYIQRHFTMHSLLPTLASMIGFLPSHEHQSLSFDVELSIAASAAVDDVLMIVHLLAG